jgi:hypothetical protein
VVLVWDMAIDKRPTVIVELLSHQIYRIVVLWPRDSLFFRMSDIPTHCPFDNTVHILTGKDRVNENVRYGSLRATLTGPDNESFYFCFKKIHRQDEYF